MRDDTGRVQILFSPYAGLRVWYANLEHSRLAFYSFKWSNNIDFFILYFKMFFKKIFGSMKILNA